MPDKPTHHPPPYWRMDATWRNLEQQVGARNMGRSASDRTSRAARQHRRYPTAPVGAAQQARVPVELHKLMLSRTIFKSISTDLVGELAKY